MNGQMRNKTRLLARASTLALLAAAGSLGAAERAQADCEVPFEVPGDATVIDTNQDCVVVNEPVEGDVENNAIVGPPGDGIIPFHVYANIGGQLINDGSILGGYANVDGEQGALTISGDATIGNGIVNNRFITSTSGNGIQIGIHSESNGYILGGISNTNSISGGRYGVAALYGSLSDGLTNGASGEDATINGGLAAIYVADTFGTWSGGITNWGQISGVNTAIKLGDGDTLYDGGDFVFNGGITNNSGATIDANGTAILISSDVSTFNGGINNSGDIEGGETAIFVDAATFNNGIVNTGTVAGYFGGIYIGATNYNGGLVNMGSITASAPLGGEAIRAETNWSGNFDNSGLISAPGGDGFEFEGSSYVGDFSNSGTISADRAVAFEREETTINNGDAAAQFVNTNSIAGVTYGFYLIGDDAHIDFANEFAEGDVVPTPTISASSGVAVLLAPSNWNGSVTNDGVINGGYIGMVIGARDDEGLYRVTDVFDGNITNTGQIIGNEYGAYITADTINGNFLNGTSGRIKGGEFGTGVFISANAFTGDITNDGTIIGGGLDTGLHVVAGTMTGNVTNNGSLSAASNALHVEIGTLNGQVVNTGKIEADTGQTAVLLEIDDNTATFINDGGGLIDRGLILGNVALRDVFFGGKTAYTFLAGDGGVEGSLLGEQDCLEGCFNNDHILVRDGTQYFVDGGGENGTASNFASFTVEGVEGFGVAVMGARSIGGPSVAGGYSFSNVDALNVNNNGTLYIDKSTTLNVDETYTQAAGGTLMFYLGAPQGGESESFSDLTGVVVAGPNDYGQIIISGTATLNGTIAGVLDDPEFANANPALTQVQYHDVIIAEGGIEGDFTTAALIQNSSLFELDSIIDGNTVDLNVTRSSLGPVGGLSNIVNTGDPFDANLAAQATGIGGCGIAGPGWCFNRYAANEPGATQVMTDATPGADPFAWLRAGARRVGETAVWGRGVGVWGDTDGDALRPGSEFSLGGAIAGIDHVFAPQLLAGAAAQWTTTDVEFGAGSGEATVDSFEVGLYGSVGDAQLFANANVSFIWHDFEVNRITGMNRANGNYDGSTISAYLEAGKTFQTDGGLRIQPLLAVSYAHLETDAYSETGTGTLLDVLDADTDTLKGVVGARVAYPFALDSGGAVVPEARIAWSHEFMDDHSSHFTDVQGGGFNPQLVEGEKFSRDTLVLGAGVTAPLSATTTVFVDYDAGLNSDITSHTVSGGLRVRW